MEKKNPLSFISFSAFLHTAVFFGLALLPILKFKEKKIEPEAAPPIEISTDSTPSAPPIEKQIQPEILPKPKQENLPKKVAALPPRHQERPPRITSSPQKQNIEKSTKKEIPESATQESIEPSESSPVVETSTTPSTPLASLEEKEKQEEKESPAADDIKDDVKSNIQQAEQEQREDAPPAPPPLIAAAPASSSASSSAATTNNNNVRSYLDLQQTPGNRPPSYPSTARRHGWQGEVILNYYVTPQGLVKDIRVMQSSGFPVLDQEAIRAISQYHYTKGQEGWAQHPVIFTLKSVKPEGGEGGPQS